MGHHARPPLTVPTYMRIDPSEISVVIQGSCVSPQTEPAPSYVVLAVESVRRHLPGARIILSTWKGEAPPADLGVDVLLLNDDPGFQPRGEAPDSKPNNVNRQIVSSRAGVRHATTKYTLKMRTDFILRGDGFLDYFGQHPAFDAEYKVVRERAVVCMYGTRKPFATHYNLPFHVSDFACFGLTEDLTNLYEIPLVTDEEFHFFRRRPSFPRGTFAVNRYNAEQSIVLNFLRKNHKTVRCDYSTHVDEQIRVESDRFLANNFVPISFARFGITPLKPTLKVHANIQKYTDYYTFVEWLALYRQYCDHDFVVPELDVDRHYIDSALALLAHVRRQEALTRTLGGNAGTGLLEILRATEQRFRHDLERLL